MSYAQPTSIIEYSCDENIKAILLRAMKLIFPVVESLLGTHSFSQIAWKYLQHKPFQLADIDRAGDGFSEYLSFSELDQETPLVVAMAKLEWKLSSISDQLSTEKSALFLIKRLFQPIKHFKLKLSPHVALITSYHHEVESWLLTQSCFLNEDIHLQERRSDYWMVQRQNSGLAFTPLNHYDYLMYSQFKHQCSIDKLSQQMGQSATQELLSNCKITPILQLV